MALIWTHVDKWERDDNQRLVRQNTKKMKKKRVSKHDVTEQSTHLCRSVTQPSMSDEAREQARVSN